MKQKQDKCEKCNRLIKNIVVYFDDEDIKPSQGINVEDCPMCSKQLFCCNRCYQALENGYERIKYKCAKFNQDEPFENETEYAHSTIIKMHLREHESVDLV